MFDDILFELVNSTKRDELEDLVCEVMTICDELKVCLSEECELGYFEACARQSAYELMLDDCRDELARSWRPRLCWRWVRLQQHWVKFG